MLRAIRPIASATVLEARRSRLFWLVAGLVAVDVCLAMFLRQVALIEAREIQAAIIAALTRAASVFLVSTFVISSMVREFNDKVVELLLAQPLPRYGYLLGKLAGFAAVSLVVGLLCALPLVLLAPPGGLLAWTISLSAELVLMAAAALFFVITLRHTVAALAAVLGFYLLARSMTAIRILAGTDPDGTWTDRLAEWLITGVSYLMPRLDGMTQTAWLVEHATSSALVSAIAQSGLYIAILAAAAMFDFHRKNL